jgi:hypothetical protein
MCADISRRPHHSSIICSGWETEAWGSQGTCPGLLATGSLLFPFYGFMEDMMASAEFSESWAPAL